MIEFGVETHVEEKYGGPAAEMRQCHLNNIHFYYYYSTHYLHPNGYLERRMFGIFNTRGMVARF